MISRKLQTHPFSFGRKNGSTFTLTAWAASDYSAGNSKFTGEPTFGQSYAWHRRHVSHRFTDLSDVVAV